MYVNVLAPSLPLSEWLVSEPIWMRLLVESAGVIGAVGWITAVAPFFAMFAILVLARRVANFIILFGWKHGRSKHRCKSPFVVVFGSLAEIPPK